VSSSWWEAAAACAGAARWQGELSLAAAAAAAAVMLPVAVLALGHCHPTLPHQGSRYMCLVLYQGVGL